MSWCEAHWARIRDNDNYNGIAASIGLMDRLVNDERFMRRCGWDPEKGTTADTVRMNAVLAEIGEVCCFLGDEIMEEIYAEALKYGPSSPRGGKA